MVCILSSGVISVHILGCFEPGSPPPFSERVLTGEGRAGRRAPPPAYKASASNPC